MKKLIAAAIALFLVGSTGLAFAQDKHGKNPAMSPKNRLERQHDRIKDGVEDGKISKKEHRKLAKEGRQINRQRKQDLRKDGGKLTDQDRAKLEKEENGRSREIYKDKHN